jgi:hypothetical protein
MSINDSPLALLRYHVTGAIERGEGEAAVERNRMLTLNLSPSDCETIAWSLDKLINYSSDYSVRFAFIYDLLYFVVSKPCNYIEMAESNYLKLADALITLESRLGCCGRQQDSQNVRRKIYQLLAA